MAAIVYQTDKRSGITYAYSSVSYWDKEKRQSRAKRTLLGRVVGDNKEIVPTDGRCRKKPEMEAEKTQIPGIARRFYGATYLLDAIGRELGITDDLKKCFPDTYRQILSVAYYLILEGKSPLYRFEKWGILHEHPYGENISSQRSSELLTSITEEAKHAFFTAQGQRRLEKEFWAYDTTSISSYSERLKQVEFGWNKEGDSLPQLNLALVFGEKSQLPFYYRKLAGNIPDAKTLKQLLSALDILGFSKVKLVMDRGFYSADNINALFRDRLKFLIATKISLVFVREALDTIYDGFRSFEHYSEKYDLYCHTVQTTWMHTQDRPRKKDKTTTPKRIAIHYYYNIDRATEDEKAFERKLRKWHQELLSGERVAAHEKAYEKYFEVKITPKRGIKVTAKKEEILKTKRYNGFFALISNEPMDAVTALELYRNKDLVEKAFGNSKELLSMRRTLVSSEQNLEGKLFIQFISLIYLSYIKKKMQESGLFKSYSLPQMLDKIDIIECFSVPGKKLQIGEVLEKQEAIYKSLGIKPPNSL